MALTLSILQGVLLIVLAFFALGIAVYVFNIGQGIVVGGSLALLGLPRWVRWILLLPTIGLSAFLLILTFNVIFWIGDWFGGSFVGTAWMWCAGFAQAVVIPNTLVAVSSMIAPNGRKWIAVAVMLVIWSWLAGTLLNPDTGEFAPPESDILGFYGTLIVAAVASAYAVIKAWAMAPLLRRMEMEMRGESDEMPASCHRCGAASKPTDSFCVNCGAVLEGA